MDAPRGPSSGTGQSPPFSEESPRTANEKAAAPLADTFPAGDAPPEASEKFTGAAPAKGRRPHFVQLDGPALPVPAPERMALLAARRRGKRKVAVIVTHGMGSQVPFETLQMVAGRLVPQAAAVAQGVMPVKVGLVDLDGTQLPRAEITIQDQRHEPVDVHFYECYWAPLTEGKVTARDSMWFLFMAGLRGLRSPGGKRTFDRWMFGDWQDFKLHHWRLGVIFLASLLTLASFLVMNLALITLTAAGWTGLLQRQGSNLLALVAADFFSFEWRAIVFLGAGIGLPLWAWKSHVSRRKRSPAGTPAPEFHLSRPVHGLVKFLVFITIALAIATGAKVAMHLASGQAADVARAFHWLGGCELWLASHAGTALVLILAIGMMAARLFLGPLINPAHSVTLPAYELVLAFAFAALIAYVAKWFLKEYVGDVAAYVSSYSVSKFDELRKEIQKTCLDVMRPVYTAREGEHFAYEEIVVVGHSLGTVISYDILNALMNMPPVARIDHEGAPKVIEVASRTKAILTFGSPLDKTAYIFRTQRPEANEVREALAAAMQPLIQNYAFRPNRWVNLYSPDDWISGSLNYYDMADAGQIPGEYRGKKIVNLADPEACVPLAAHIFYWDSQLFGNELYQAIIS